MTSRRPASSAWWTGLLSAALAAAAVAELLGFGHRVDWPLLPIGPSSALVLTAAIGALFALTELGLVNIEFRDEAYSFSLSGIPLVLGLLTCPPTYLVAARVAGAVVVFALQRPSPVKAVYNTCAYAFEAATVATVVHLALISGARLDLATGAVCFVVVAAVDLLMSVLVVLVISLHGSRLTRRDVAGILAPASAFSVIGTASALGAAILVASGALGIALLVAGGLCGGVLFRSYLKRRRQHESLALLHDFVEQGAGVHDLDEMARRLLGRLRTVLRASEVELVIGDPDHLALPTTRLVVGESGAVLTRRGAPVSADWLLLRAVSTQEPSLLRRRSPDAALGAWLAARGFRDAVVVPVPGAGAELALIASNRLGETTTFTGEDVTLARTLAGHLGVAMNGTRVVDQLRHDARHDPLTGLPNRALLGERLTAAFAEEEARPTAVLLLDLDRFKDVNDALGHHVGDDLLRVVADRLRAAVPEGTLVARLGGDEFAVLVRCTGDPRTHATAVASDLARVLAEPVQLAEALVSTGASIGVAVATPGLTESDMLRHADTAMYAAKESGQLVVYTDDLDRGRAERLALLADLHRALDRDEFELRYQPQLDLRSRRIVAVEALVRWNHPTLGLLAPDAFIGLAESTGLIHPLTDVVLRKALRQCREWSMTGYDLSVAVNLSARSVTSGLPEKVGAALAEAGLSPRRLVLEITESAVMHDPDRAVQILAKVADIGVALSLDDFGTGYSSLSYLQRLPVQEVKIDRSFVSGLIGPSSSRASEALIRSMVTVGENLGLRIVAEGVEDAETLEHLRQMGCDLAQGYHIGRPGTPEQLAELLAVPAVGRRPRLTAVT